MLDYKEVEPIVLQEIRTNEFDIRRLINGGTIDSQGNLLTIQAVVTGKGKTKTGKDFNFVTLQIISKGINNPVKRKDVVIKKVVEKQTVIKEVAKKPIIKQGTEQATVLNAEEY